MLERTQDMESETLNLGGSAFGSFFQPLKTIRIYYLAQYMLDLEQIS